MPFVFEYGIYRLSYDKAELINFKVLASAIQGLNTRKPVSGVSASTRLKEDSRIEMLHVRS